jgi:hypothetical protein
LPNINQISRLNAMGGVFGVDIPGQGASSYLIYATNFQDRNIYRAYGVGNLNPSGQGFQRMTNFVANGTVMFESLIFVLSHKEF